MDCFRPRREILYVILPYFNYCGFKRRRDLFVDFIDRYGKEPGIKIVVAEAVGKAPLPKLPVFKHLKFQTESPLWIKENLINLATHQLPSSWKYMAWIDADLLFLNADWVEDTIEALQTADFVQMWQTAVNLGPYGEAMKIDKSFGYMHVKSGRPYTQTDKYGFWHPGYAWATKREVMNHLGGILDWAILGSADRHMALALINRVEWSAPGTIHPNYKAMLLQYQDACKHMTLSYVPGTILHLWHGRLEDRKYRERWDILTKNQFDPATDAVFTKKGVLVLTEKGKRLEKELLEYFVGRKEDA
jgi:hypothetical protein